MSYAFKSISAECEDVIFAAFEGDNEICIADVGSNGTSCYLLLICNNADEGFELLRDEYDTLAAAFFRLAIFMRDEYEVSFEAIEEEVL